MVIIGVNFLENCHVTPNRLAFIPWRLVRPDFGEQGHKLSGLMCTTCYSDAHHDHALTYTCPSLAAAK